MLIVSVLSGNDKSAAVEGTYYAQLTGLTFSPAAQLPYIAFSHSKLLSPTIPTTSPLLKPTPFAASLRPCASRRALDRTWPRVKIRGGEVSGSTCVGRSAGRCWRAAEDIGRAVTGASGNRNENMDWRGRGGEA